MPIWTYLGYEFFHLKYIFKYILNGYNVEKFKCKRCLIGNFFLTTNNKKNTNNIYMANIYTTVQNLLKQASYIELTNAAAATWHDN